MKLYVYKNPNPTTLAECREVADDAVAPQAPWELMTVAEFAAWNAAQTPLPDPGPSVPMMVTPWQLRRALNAAGKRAQVEAYIATLSSDLQDDWNLASFIRRASALVASLMANFGWSKNQVDNFFINVAKL